MKTGANTEPACVDRTRDSHIEADDKRESSLARRVQVNIATKCQRTRIRDQDRGAVGLFDLTSWEPERGTAGISEFQHAGGQIDVRLHNEK